MEKLNLTKTQRKLQKKNPNKSIEIIIEDIYNNVMANFDVNNL